MAVMSFFMGVQGSGDGLEDRVESPVQARIRLGGASRLPGTIGPACTRPLRVDAVQNEMSSSGVDRPLQEVTTADPSGAGQPRAAAGEPLLRVRGLAKRFGDHEVLRGIDLDVMPADRIAILGASGSGKSTLLRCLNFMEVPTAGTVELAGRPIGRAAPTKDAPGRRLYDEAELTRVRQRVGMVFQQFNLFPHMTAVGNVMEGLRTVRGQRDAEARVRAEAELARVGLADKAQAYPARLSGGQKQRVAIARALAMDPEILLFDEPTSALDPELVGEVLRVIRSLAEEGRTMLLVTHELGFAYHVANRVLFIADGTIHEQGPPEQVLKQPVQPKTQAFLQRHREFDF
jgi:polar amino acid transport system ATP-binding protein